MNNNFRILIIFYFVLIKINVCGKPNNFGITPHLYNEYFVINKDLYKKSSIYTDTLRNDTTLVFLAEQKNFLGSIAVGDGLRKLAGSGEQGKENTVFGMEAGKELTSGKYNTLIGYMAGSRLQSDSIQLPYASSKNSATGNVFVGRPVGSVAVNALDNTIVGTGGGTNLTDGMDNVFMGVWSGYNIQGGSENVAIGHASLMYLIGQGSYDTGTGHRNTALGDMSGRFINGTQAGKTGGKNSLYIGARTTSSGNDVVNENVIGYGAQGMGSNSVVIGNNEVENTFISGRPHFVNIKSKPGTANLFIDPESGELKKIEGATNGFMDFTPAFFASDGEFGGSVVVKKARYHFNGVTVNFIIDFLVPKKGTAHGILIATLPIPANGPWNFMAYEHNNSGVQLRASASGPQRKTSVIDNVEFSTVRIVDQNNLGNIISDNRRFVVSGTYEALIDKSEQNLVSSSFFSNNQKIAVQKDNQIDNGFVIFPNPADDLLYFTMDDLETVKFIEIYDISGRLVKTIQNPFKNGNFIKVDHLSSGIYIININKNSIKFYKK